MAVSTHSRFVANCCTIVAVFVLSFTFNSASVSATTELSDAYLEYIAKLPPGVYPDQWSCDYVLRNADRFGREVATRRLGREHKIIKFIENCYKTADGWRFKKSTTSKQLKSSLSHNNKPLQIATVADYVGPSTQDVNDFWNRFFTAQTQSAELIKSSNETPRSSQESTESNYETL